jgi:imidazole glycerol phosphate synthase glutamine amidotransferase subunit
MISILDLGTGNIRSLENTLDLINVPYERISSKDELKIAEKVVLPGNGAFDSIMGTLCKKDLTSLLKQRILDGMPYLGICVGMQILFEGSDEGTSKGLSLIPSRIKRFENYNNYAHIGWETVISKNGKEIGEYYFMHEYRSDILEEEYQYLHCKFPKYFSCGVNIHNATGIQFHPEKSGSVGSEFLLNWCNYGL